MKSITLIGALIAALGLAIPASAEAATKCPRFVVKARGYYGGSPAIRVSITKTYGRASCATMREAVTDLYKRRGLTKYCRGRRVSLGSFCFGYQTHYRVKRYLNWRLGFGAGGGGGARGPVNRPTDSFWWEWDWA